MRGARLLTSLTAPPWRSISSSTTELHTSTLEELLYVATTAAAEARIGRQLTTDCRSRTPEPHSRPACPDPTLLSSAAAPAQPGQHHSSGMAAASSRHPPMRSLPALPAGMQRQTPWLPGPPSPGRHAAAQRLHSTAAAPPPPPPSLHRVGVQVSGTPVQFETGAMALQASGSCLASSGSTHVLATVTCATPEAADSEEVDGMPLQVDYTEGAYARGKLPELNRRDRMDDEHILCARAIDRSIRPLFPPGFYQEIHVCARVLSAGGSMDPEVLAINAASAALMCSDIPWAGPVGAVCIVRVDGVLKVGTSEPQQQGLGPAWALAAERLHSGSSSSSSGGGGGGGGDGAAPSGAAPPPLRQDFKLLFAGTKDKVMMVELEADEVSEEELCEALALAQQQVAALVEGQLQLAARAGKPKRRVQLLGSSQHAEHLVIAEAQPLLDAVFRDSTLNKEARGAAVMRVKAQVQAALKARGVLLDAAKGKEAAAPQAQAAPAAPTAIAPIPALEFPHAFETVLSDCMRRLVLDHGRRVDGRDLRTIRPIACDALPLQPSKVHGASLFSRGETQALCLATVGEEHPQNPWQELHEAQQDEDAVDATFVVGADGDGGRAAAGAREGGALRRRAPLVLHYEFPPYSVNETGKINPLPSRREVGHGALALKGLQASMPDHQDFSFLVRLAAMTMGSNGSSSMAAVCGGSMALHMAEVPVSELVAGISVGLVSEEWLRPRAGTAGGGGGGGGERGLLEGGYGRQALLVDIQGMEDALGDMDFKVAGTKNGITALQLDTKLPGLSTSVLFEAVGLARKAHRELLGVMQAALAEARARRDAVPQHAVQHIAEDLVEALIGEGGGAMAALRERSGAAVAVRPGGEVQVYAPSAPALALALQGIRAVDGSDLEPGMTYAARVHELFDYGAVLEMASGARHLLPISEVSHTKLRDISDVLCEGQVLRVKCLGRDNKGLLKLSYKALQEAPPAPPAPPQERQQKGQGKQGR